MDKLITDCGRAEVSNRVIDICRNYVIKMWQSEPYHKHQNPDERRIQYLKRTVNFMLDICGAPPELWLLALEYVCFVLNHTATESLGWKTPMEALTGTTPDISMITKFVFYESIYFSTADAMNYASKPSDTADGISENIGDTMTFKVLSVSTKQIFIRYMSDLQPTYDIRTKEPTR